MIPSAPSTAEPVTRTVRLQSGVLTLRVTQADFPLDELCGFASRANPKRGYLFVSKVLGKHCPTCPAVMDFVYERLAAKLACDGPTVVLGMAETATALSHGVYEHLRRRTGNEDLLFQHTTRYALRRPLACEFAETHSHAPQHLLHEADAPEDQRLFAEASHLILIDDELSTGATLANLIQAYRQVNPRLESIQIVCLTNWQSKERDAWFCQAAGVPTQFHSLLRGDFDFEPDPDFRPPALKVPMTGSRFYDEIVPFNFGRLGIRGELRFPFEQSGLLEVLGAEDRVLVLGSGEFAYPPLLLARWLQSHGRNVRFQTTTRSPILPGGAIASVISGADNYHEGIPNFVYNVAGLGYDRILLCYETPVLPASHDLAERLKAVAVFFEPTGLRVRQGDGEMGRQGDG
jgi:hypothetical protein